MLYEASLKRKRDTASVISSAERLGMEKGEHKKAVAIALKFKQMGISIEKIAEGTGFSIEEIEKL